jgi:hypothetical protein
MSGSEEADDCRAIVAKLNDSWRVIVCAAGIQWILQRRSGKRHGRARWEGRSFCRTREPLIRVSREHAGAVDPAAAAILAALPDRVETHLLNPTETGV